MSERIYTYEETRDRIPDYCFGGLTDDERMIFKASIVKYDDLMDDVNEISSSFSSIDNNLYNEIIEQKTRNLSVKVNERLAEKNHSNVFRNLKFAVPVLSVLVLLFIIIKPFSNNDNIWELSEKYVTITNDELDDVISDQTNELELLNIVSNDKSADIPDFSDFTENIEEIYDEIALDDFFDSFDYDNALQERVIMSEASLYSIIDSFDNDDFEEIIKEIGDVKIIS